MQAWEQQSFSPKWCREMRLDARGMNFAREVRRQLTDLVKRADFLPDKELAVQGKSSKRKRDDSDGEPWKSLLDVRRPWSYIPLLLSRFATPSIELTTEYGTASLGCEGS